MGGQYEEYFIDIGIPEDLEAARTGLAGSLRKPAAFLDQPVGERRFAVIDMGNDREIADMREVGHVRESQSTKRRPNKTASCRPYARYFTTHPETKTLHARSRFLPPVSIFIHTL